MARKEEPKILPNNDLEKKIIEAFEVFDHSGKQVVDVREIGTILRSLAKFPTSRAFEILSTGFYIEPLASLVNRDLMKDTCELALFNISTRAKNSFAALQDKQLLFLGCCPTEAEVQEVILATENKEATGNVPLVNFLPFIVKAMTEHRFYPASADVLLAAFRYFDEDGRGYLTKERFSKLMLEEGEPFTQEEYEEMMQTALDPVTDTITYEYYINHLMIAPKEVYNSADQMEQERKRLEAAAPKKRRAESLLRAAQR